MNYFYEYHKVRAQLSILKDVVKTYPTSSIPNVIQQLESRLKHIMQNLDTQHLD